MDNTEDLGAAMAAAAAKDQAKSQEARIQELEHLVRELTRELRTLLHAHYGVKAPNAYYQRTQSGGESQMQKAQAQYNAAQPQGWYGYTGDAGGPLKY